MHITRLSQAKESRITVESIVRRADRTTPPRVNTDFVICLKQDRFHQYSMLQARVRRVSVYIVLTGSGSCPGMTTAGRARKRDTKASNSTIEQSSAMVAFTVARANRLAVR
jgi:hypothetical protein